MNKKEGNMPLLIVEIITPESFFCFKDVHMAVLPGSEGEFGVLPGHVALISSLEEGVVTIFEGNHMKVTNRISISAGFAEVTGKSVTILVEQATDLGHH